MMGFAAAGGEYIMTCHDHDGYAPTLLEELAGALDRYPTASFAHCAVVVVDAEERELERYVRDYPSLMPGKSFMTQALLPGIACPVTALCMVRASALRGKALDPYFGPCADVELWLRLCTVGDVAYVKKELIRIRQRGPDSEFNELGCALASYTLAAKRAYSAWLDSDRQRAAVERGWRREADYTAFSELLKGLQGRKRLNCAELLAFLRENGSTTGVVALTAVSRLPARFAERMLCLATPVAKAFAGMRVTAEQLPESKYFLATQASTTRARGYTSSGSYGGWVTRSVNSIPPPVRRGAGAD